MTESNRIEEVDISKGIGMVLVIDIRCQAALNFCKSLTRKFMVE